MSGNLKHHWLLLAYSLGEEQHFTKHISKTSDAMANLGENCLFSNKTQLGRLAVGS